MSFVNDSTNRSMTELHSDSKSEMRRKWIANNERRKVQRQSSCPTKSSSWNARRKVMRKVDASSTGMRSKTGNGPKKKGKCRSVWRRKEQKSSKSNSDPVFTENGKIRSYVSSLHFLCAFDHKLCSYNSIPFVFVNDSDRIPSQRLNRLR